MRTHIIMRVNIIKHMHTQAGGVYKLFQEITVLTAQAVCVHDSITGEEMVSTVTFCLYSSYSPERLLLRWFSDGWGGSSTGLDPCEKYFL